MLDDKLLITINQVSYIYVVKEIKKYCNYVAFSVIV